MANLNNGSELLRTYYSPEEITPLLNKYSSLKERYSVLSGEISLQAKAWLDECKTKYNINYKNNLYYIMLLLYLNRVSSGKVQHPLYINNNPNVVSIAVKLPETVKVVLTDTYNKKYVNEEGKPRSYVGIFAVAIDYCYTNRKSVEYLLDVMFNKHNECASATKTGYTIHTLYCALYEKYTLQKYTLLYIDSNPTVEPTKEPNEPKKEEEVNNNTISDTTTNNVTETNEPSQSLSDKLFSMPDLTVEKAIGFFIDANPNILQRFINKDEQNVIIELFEELNNGTLSSMKMLELTTNIK